MFSCLLLLTPYNVLALFCMKIRLIVVIWIFSETEQNFQQRDKLSPVFKCGFLRSEENVDVNNFIHMKVYQ